MADILAPPAVPRQLPPPSPHFADRRALLVELDAAADTTAESTAESTVNSTVNSTVRPSMMASTVNPAVRDQVGGVPGSGGRTPRLVVLRGPGGVGKSAVALRWLDGALDRFPDGQLHADLTGAAGQPVAAADVLGTFLRGLDVAPERVPVAASERATLFRSVTSNKAIAVLLENPVSAAQVTELLPPSGHSIVVVTTRRALPGLVIAAPVVIAVEPFDEAGALELVARHVGADRLAAEQPFAQDLVRLCGRLPLALCVAAALLVQRPRRSVADLVEQLRDERRRVEVLSSVEDLSVRATLDVSYQGLSPRAAAAYRALGSHPGHLMSGELVAAACRMSREVAVAALDELHRASLLDEIDEHLYRANDLVRAHALVVADQERDEASHASDAMHRRVVEWHLFVAQAAGTTAIPARRVLSFDFTDRYLLPGAIGEPAGALAWLERHRLDLSAATQAAFDVGWHQLAHHLGDALQPLFIVHKHHHLAAQVDHVAVEAATVVGDRLAEIAMRSRLARVLLWLGDLDNAQHHVDELLRTAAQYGGPRERARALKTLGGLHSRRGDHGFAAEAFGQARDIVRSLGRSRAEGLVLIDLGRTLIELGRLRDALTELGAAQALLSGLDPADEYNAARAGVEAGRAYLRLGEHRTARRLLEDTIPTLANVGATYELGRAHGILADVFTAAGDRVAADEHRRRAERLRAAVTVSTTNKSPLR